MDVRSNFRKINVKSPHFPDIAKPSQDVFCGSGVSRDIPTSSFHQLLPCKPSRPSLYSAGHFFYLRVQTYEKSLNLSVRCSSVCPGICRTHCVGHTMGGACPNLADFPQ